MPLGVGEGAGTGGWNVTTSGASCLVGDPNGVVRSVGVLGLEQGPAGSHYAALATGDGQNFLLVDAAQSEAYYRAVAEPVMQRLTNRTKSEKEDVCECTGIISCGATVAGCVAACISSMGVTCLGCLASMTTNCCDCVMYQLGYDCSYC